MLTPTECLAGPVSMASAMTLIMPRTSHEHLALIVESEGKKHLVALGERYLFASFECETNDDWTGLHIRGVSIELDETALFDNDGYYPPVGSMVRSDDNLSVHVSARRGGSARDTLLPILTGLPKCGARSSVCFLRWQIVVGEGDAKRVLQVVDVRSKQPV